MHEINSNILIVLSTHKVYPSYLRKQGQCGKKVPIILHKRNTCLFSQELGNNLNLVLACF